MGKIETAVQWAINTANDNSHGYSQTSRGGNPDYDCSSFVIAAWANAGVNLKSKGASYTGNMRLPMLNSGFRDVTGLVNLATGAGLKLGDVLLNYADHVAISLGNGKIVHARGNDGHPEKGDQTGREICVDNYYKFADCVLRYDESTNQESASILDWFKPKPKEEKQKVETGLSVDGICGQQTWMALAKRMPTIRNGSKSEAVKALQAMLNFLGAELDVDGECGVLTEAEIKEFQGGSL